MNAEELRSTLFKMRQRSTDIEKNIAEMSKELGYLGISILLIENELKGIESWQPKKT